MMYYDKTPIKGYSLSDVLQVSDLETYIEHAGVHGFIDRDETEISFDEGTSIFSLTRTGNDFSYYRDGQLCVISDDKTITIPGDPPVAADYYIYIDNSSGTLEVSTDLWTIGSSKVFVAVIVYSNSLTPKSHLLDERHTSKLPKIIHRYLHNVFGTQVISQGLLTGYTVTAGSPANDASNTFVIGETEIADEDIFHILSEFPKPISVATGYTIVYRTDATSWVWLLKTVPYHNAGSGYMYYDNAGTLTEGDNGKYYNTYLLATPDGYISIHGRSEFSSLANAQAEEYKLFSFTGYPFSETVVCYQLTWVCNASYTTTGKCKLAAEPRDVYASVVSGKVTNK